MKMRFERDIHAPLTTQRPVTLLMQGDALANEIQIDLTDNNAPYLPEGYSIEARLIRSDGYGVRCKGTIDGNTVYVILDAGCYEVPGSYAMYVRLVSEDKSIRRTILRIAGDIESEGSGLLIDGDRVFYSIEELVKQIERMESATLDAEQQAQNAEEKADTAHAAASAANSAALKIERMTVSAQEGDAVGAKISEQDGAKHVDFTLRRGAPGHGMKVLGIYETIQELSSNVITPTQGDMYLVGITSPYALYMFNSEGSVTGWIYLGSAQGAGVASVAGIMPDSGGNVELSAEDVGARPATWTPNAKDVGALPEGWLPSIFNEGKALLQVLTGSLTFQNVASNTTVSRAISFNPPFASAPFVIAATRHTTPTAKYVNAYGASVEGSTIYARNETDTEGTINAIWMAVGPALEESGETGE